LSIAAQPSAMSANDTDQVNTGDGSSGHVGQKVLAKLESTF
jgi:hypothetical protein